MARKIVLVSVIFLSAFLILLSCTDSSDPNPSVKKDQAGTEKSDKVADKTEIKLNAEKTQAKPAADGVTQVKNDTTLVADNTKVEQTGQKKDVPSAFPVEKEYKFQSVPDGTEIVHDFVIENRGNALLKIVKVKAG